MKEINELIREIGKALQRIEELEEDRQTKLIFLSVRENLLDLLRAVSSQGARVLLQPKNQKKSGAVKVGLKILKRRVPDMEWDTIFTELDNLMSLAKDK